MKTIFHKFFLILLIAFGKTVSAQMVLEYDIVTSSYRQIVLPLKGTVNVSVDWGDGSAIETFTTSGYKSHDYVTSGTKTVTITGSLSGYGGLLVGEGNTRLIRVLKWDGLGIESFDYAFLKAVRLTQVPNSLPSTVTKTSNMFFNATSFNQPIGSWNTAAVTDMSNMFNGATAFNQPIGSWNTAAVTNMSKMFQYATAFNQPIGSWNTGNVLDMSSMFSGATAFNQPIAAWNTAKVVNMDFMFSNTTTFNQPIDTWNTEKTTSMVQMFYKASSFNQPINNWNTVAVTNMSGMFYYATTFNQPIGNWNTSAVARMDYMFSDATSFNQPIGTWNTAKVIYMDRMFANAITFNQPIGSWNTIGATVMYSMFFGAKAFNQPLGSWKFYAEIKLNNMLDGSGMDCNNYSNTLNGWANNPSCPTGRSLGAVGIPYNSTGSVARTLLTTPIANGGKGWTITGDVLVNDCVVTSSEDHSNTTISPISISPNPSSNGDFVINSNKNINEVIVTDLSGKQERFFDTQNIHTELKGLLLIRAISENDTEIQKVVVE